MSEPGQFHGFAALAAKSALAPFSYTPADLGAHGVELEVSHCGLCFSDVHLIDDDWKRSAYPFIPGHEVVGKVVRRGSEVSQLAIGQRVGVGWQRGACLQCELCLNGHENLCEAQTATCVGFHGGLADRMIADARFAIPIPDALDSASAAPLLCGGVTVYAPMRNYGVSGASRVGVIGIGGLGHIAIRLLAAMGAEITAFTSTPDKHAEAKRLGAHHAVASNEVREVRKVAGTLDLILSTVHARLDWTAYLQALRPNGTLVMLGGGTGMVQFAQFALHGQKSIASGEIGSRAAIAELLQFAARNQIAPQIEVSPLPQVQAAIDRLRANAVRYRAVLANI